jgi:hypothetical protein
MIYADDVNLMGKKKTINKKTDTLVTHCVVNYTKVYSQFVIIHHLVKHLTVYGYLQ